LEGPAIFFYPAQHPKAGQHFTLSGNPGFQVCGKMWNLLPGLVGKILITPL
jgi:hypothetical protein